MLSTDDTNKKMLDLPSNIIVQHVLSLFAGSPVDIIRFGRTCKTAHRLSSDADLWSGFCKIYGFNDPSTWNALDYRHLYLALVLPYSHLLNHTWHSDTWPVGQVLKVDAEPPRLVARSLYFKSLNAGPYCHEVFVVELVPGQMKARVTCWRDRHGPQGTESEAALLPAAECAQSRANGTPSSTAEALDLAVPATARAADVSSSGNVGPVCLRHEFRLCCQSCCDSVVTEYTNRKTRARPYQQVRQRYLEAASAGNNLNHSRHQQQQNAQQQQIDDDVSMRSSSTMYSSLPPLPDVRQLPTMELIQFITLSDMQPVSRAPSYRRLDLSAGPSSSSSSSPQLKTTSSAMTSKAAAVCGVAHHDHISDSVVGMTGLWRGSYGSHGVELLQLRLCDTPAGYDMFEAQRDADSNEDIPMEAAAAAPGSSVSVDVVAALAADDTADSRPGVLLQGVPGAAAGRTAADMSTLYAELPDEEGAAAAGAASFVVVYDNPAGAAAATQQQPDAVAGDDHNSSQPRDQQTVTAGSSWQQQQQQQRPGQLLLVATKLTGDMNVPVGCVSFAVDVNSKVSGTNELLQLPPGIDSDVPINTPGTRQLRIKERYRGRAQIAFTGFQAPAVIAAELLVFTDSDVLGLLWKKPVDSFSLFSKVHQLM